jgi:hypothetical protein
MGGTAANGMEVVSWRAFETEKGYRRDENVLNPLGVTQ